MRKGSWPVLFLVALSLMGCSPLVDRDQVSQDPAATIPLAAPHAVGQTFVARHAGLSGIEIWLEPTQEQAGDMILHLCPDVGSSNDLAVATLSTSRVTQPGFYRFTFPPQHDSHSRYYYAFLEPTGPAHVNVGSGHADAYLDGALYRDHKPIDGQATFRLVYDPRYVLADLARATTEGMGLLFIACLLYVVPGWAVLTLLGRKDAFLADLHWAVKLGVAAGISLSVYPLFMLWAYAARLRLGAMIAWLPMAGGLVILVGYYRPWRITWRTTRAWLFRQPSLASLWPNLAIFAVILLAAMGRLLFARGLEMPLWDDSVQHTVMVQRILESGGLFRSWEPYAPYESLSTHFGFHANVAVWAWFMRLGAPQAMIWAGQILNLLAVVTLFPLAYRIKGTWAGLVTLLVAGILILFPAYYTNWGRYPQMAGQAILPVAAWWFWMMWENEKARRVGVIVVGAALILGMCLSYYRMFFHYLAFILALLTLNPKQIIPVFRRGNWLAIVGMAMCTILFAIPWFGNIAAGASVVEENMAALPTPKLGFWPQFEAMTIKWPAPKAVVIFLGTLAGVWLGGGAALPALWTWILTALPILQLTSLPGVQIIQVFTIETSLYITQALIWGVVAGFVIEAISAPNRWLSALLAALVVVTAAYRLPSLIALADRGYDLSTRPDMRAAEWVRTSLPGDAFFLINGIIYTDKVSVVGGDGGWWLPILTGRGVVIPPQYALLSERANPPNYSEAVNNLIRQLVVKPIVAPENRAALCDFPRQITHVYIGQRRGMVSKPLPYPPSHPMLDPQILLQDPAFRLIYHRDRVMIFEINRSALCP